MSVYFARVKTFNSYSHLIRKIYSEFTEISEFEEYFFTYVLLFISFYYCNFVILSKVRSSFIKYYNFPKFYHIYA